jgi:hypothetical protein
LLKRLEPFEQAPVGRNRKMVIRELEMWISF